MTRIEVDRSEGTLSELLSRVEQGESFTLLRDGKPRGTLQPVSAITPGRFRLGALEGKGVIPDDIKGPYEAEINEMFYGE